MTQKAILCNKYEFSINVPLKDESNKKRNDQSYLHFITSRQDLVSAKCIATEWLLNDVNINKEYSIREYFAGVGIQATLLQNMLNVNLVPQDSCQMIDYSQTVVPAGRYLNYCGFTKPN